MIPTSNIVKWEGWVASLAQGISGGGPVGLVWGWVFVSVGVTCTGLSLAELARYFGISDIYSGSALLTVVANGLTPAVSTFGSLNWLRKNGGFCWYVFCIISSVSISWYLIAHASSELADCMVLRRWTLAWIYFMCSWRRSPDPGLCDDS